MRTAFLETLLEVAARDPRVWLVAGDIGYSVLEPFITRFPERYLNAGVAEQNMVGVAAGLAMAGKVVYTYSIANFPVVRCLEQIRNDVCYHRLDVRVVAVGGGLAYGSLGYTHHGLEDLAMLGALPHMTVLAPGDPVETRLAVRALADWRGPAYLRLGKAGEPVVHTTEPPFAIGKLVPVRDGDAAVLFTTGATLQLAVQAADTLAAEGVEVAVVSVPTLKPLDTDAVAAAVRARMRVVTVEEHGPGGLGSAVAEVIATRVPGARMVCVRLEGEPVAVAGSQAYLRGCLGLTRERVVQAVRDLGVGRA
jgi:transketolase